MPPLLEAIQYEIVVREGEDVGGKGVQTLPPIGAALPFPRPSCWRTSRRYDDGLTPSAFAAAHTGSFWLATLRSCRSSTVSRGRPRRLPSLLALIRYGIVWLSTSDLFAENVAHVR